MAPTLTFDTLGNGGLATATVVSTIRSDRSFCNRVSYKLLLSSNRDFRTCRFPFQKSCRTRKAVETESVEREQDQRHGPDYHMPARSRGTTLRRIRFGKRFTRLLVLTVILYTYYLQETAVKLATVKKSVYANYKQTIEKLLNLTDTVDVNGLCVQLGCTSVRELATDILELVCKNSSKVLKTHVPFLFLYTIEFHCHLSFRLQICDGNTPQFVCMAVYQACKWAFDLFVCSSTTYFSTRRFVFAESTRSKFRNRKFYHTVAWNLDYGTKWMQNGRK